MEGRDEKGRFIEKNIWAYVKKNVGRPPKYETPEELLDKALEYFDYCDQHRKGRFNSAHLRLWLGLTKENWLDYKQRPNFFTTIRAIEAYYEGDYEDKLMWAGSTQGAIFKLKNLCKWTDEVVQHQNITEVKAKFGGT